MIRLIALVEIERLNAMYMNFTSSGDFCVYGVPMIPGQSMESSAIPCGAFNLTSRVAQIPDPNVGPYPNIDWDNIVPSYDGRELRSV